MNESKFLYTFNIFFVFVAIAVAITQVPKDDTPTVPILMYHYFAPGEASSVIVDPDVFREQLKYLLAEGYETITDEELLLFLQGELEIEKPLLITIDDGYTNNYEYAYPILKDLGVTATIYTITSYRGQTPGYNAHFDWDQAREMYQSGHVELQSHTHDLHYAVDDTPALVARLEGESEEDYRRRIRADLKKSKLLLEEEVGTQVITISYPYGTYNDTVVEVSKELGYELGLTVRPGVNRPGDNPFALKRINVPGHYSGEDIVREINRY
ncbi:peptidoglycan/xylan/chitin deacetylase (PgdA/CDA1 family) [Desulfitispora alkaliphila]|uniref:polysaccharide deacetylase family protein n=1 Tax=Desulfitispora alkaliphila TaxID=622674 RepID=UPI003D1F2757